MLPALFGEELRRRGSGPRTYDSSRSSNGPPLALDDRFNTVVCAFPITEGILGVSQAGITDDGLVDANVNRNAQKSMRGVWLGMKLKSKCGIRESSKCQPISSPPPIE